MAAINAASSLRRRHCPCSCPCPIFQTGFSFRNIIFSRKTTRRKTSTMTSSAPQQQQQQQLSTLPENHLAVVKYHEETKHSFRKYARGPHGLDWANQPNPFRRYESAPLIPLIHLPPGKTDTNELPYHHLFLQFPAAKALDKSTVSQLFYDSLALSAWKTTGYSTWSLRVNPSSGNLHPTESYIISGPISGISESAFVAHYAPKEHALEIRAEIPLNLWAELSKGLPENSFFVGLSSIFWREAWKYGERAYRYCNHDVGHAIGAVSIAAAVLGWDTRLIDGLGHREVDILLGLAGQKELTVPDGPVKGYMPELEQEHADCLIAVFPAQNSFGSSSEAGTSGRSSPELKIDYGYLSSVVSRFEGLDFKGRRNALSKEHVCWDTIYRTANAAKKPMVNAESAIKLASLPKMGIFSEAAYQPFSVREVVRKRRSAVDMDVRYSIERNTFYQLMSKAIPSGWQEESQGEEQQLPFRVLPWRAQLHMVLFVHRVVGLKKGIYFLVRNSDHFNDLKSAMKPEFEWEKPDNCPSGLPLYRLAAGDCRELAKRLSCHQDIAGDGCFSLGMLAHFEPTLCGGHAWMYPRLFWEAGLLGQILYLEAHAVGISATGIGCYFDDPGIPNKHEPVKYFPCMPTLSSANLPWLIGRREDREFRFQFWLRNISRFRQLRWVLCNSFHALEHSIISTFPKEAGICPVGPLLPQKKKEKKEKEGCLQWLDKQALGSVIYVSFGSSIVLKEKQVEEVAAALESTGRPFMWVVRGIEKFVPAPYLERNGECKYILSWAPQMSVLSHRSVGCFVTHCGWNSTLESITAGVPMLCWPCVADQFLNCAYIVDIWKIGLALSANDEGTVEKVEIEECLQRIMATGEGAEIRRRAQKLKECAVNATAESSSINFTSFLNAMKTNEGG